MALPRVRRMNSWHQFGAYFLVAVYQSQRVGYIRGTVSVGKDLAVLPDGQSYAEIEDLYISPSLRSQSLGSRLMEQFEHTARQNGMHRFRVHSATKDLDRILAFSRGHGYKSWWVNCSNESVA
jgi:ribosomal protein S18 acetylase RimI-like enzyme